MIDGVTQLILRMPEEECLFNKWNTIYLKFFSFTLTVDFWDSQCLRIKNGSHCRKIARKWGYCHTWISHVIHSAIAATSSVYGMPVLMWLLGVFLTANVSQQNSLFRHQSVEQNFLPCTRRSHLRKTNFMRRDLNVR